MIYCCFSIPLGFILSYNYLKRVEECGYILLGIILGLCSSTKLLWPSPFERYTQLYHHRLVITKRIGDLNPELVLLTKYERVSSIINHLYIYNGDDDYGKFFCFRHSAICQRSRAPSNNRWCGRT